MLLAAQLVLSMMDKPLAQRSFDWLRPEFYYTLLGGVAQRLRDVEADKRSRRGPAFI